MPVVASIGPWPEWMIRSGGDLLWLLFAKQLLSGAVEAPDRANDYEGGGRRNEHGDERHRVSSHQSGHVEILSEKVLARRRATSVPPLGLRDRVDNAVVFLERHSLWLRQLRGF